MVSDDLKSPYDRVRHRLNLTGITVGHSVLAAGQAGIFLVALEKGRIAFLTPEKLPNPDNELAIDVVSGLLMASMAFFFARSLYRGETAASQLRNLTPDHRNLTNALCAGLKKGAASRLFKKLQITAAATAAGTLLGLSFGALINMVELPFYPLFYKHPYSSILLLASGAGSGCLAASIFKEIAVHLVQELKKHPHTPPGRENNPSP